MAIILGETGRNDVCLLLGKQGEHDVTFFEFDFSLWAAKYGDGVLSLRLTPNGSTTAYPVTLDFDGTVATFTVTATDTATAGLGSAELVYIVGDDEKLKKSVSYVTSVEPSDDTGEAPEPYDEWLARLEVLAGETSQAKTDAEQAASEAKASELAAAASEQNAKTSEDNAEEYADRIADLTVSAHEATGETPTVIKTIVNDVYNLDFGLVPGKDGEDGKDGQDGADGVGIASVALNSDYTLTITLTDGRTYTTTSIRGEQGETGLTPDFTIGTVTTLEPGSQATATITGTDEEPVLNLGIPKGDTGEVSMDDFLKVAVTDTASGSGVVTIPDGANLPMKSLKVTLTPQQDGTPWIGTTHDTTPYLHRAMPTQSNDYNRESGVIVGGTVNWNQLINPSGYNTQTVNGVTMTKNNDGSVTFSGTATADASFSLLNTHDNPLVKGRVYYVHTCPQNGGRTTYYGGVAGLRYDFGDGAIFKHSYDWGVTDVRLDVVSGATISGTVYPQYIDLTAMFNPTIADHVYSLEQTTAGSGIAWLKSYGFLTEDYIPYSANTLQSVQATAHKTYDADGNVIGEYALDSSLTLRGMPRLDASNNLYYDGDTYASDGTVTRNTIYRAYQSGDESLANAITDGTNTVVYSANASTETADPYTNPQIVDPDGTEEYVTANSVPVGHDSTYSLVCPISGYDSVSANVVGKNLIAYPYSHTTRTTNGITYTDNGDGTITAEGTATNTAYFNLRTGTDYMELEAGTYTYSVDVQGVRMNWYVDDNGTWVNKGAALQGAPITFTIDKKTKIYGFLVVASGATVSNVRVKPQLELGSTATDYEPYQGQTHTATLPETVYGGTVDLVSGVLTVDRGYRKFTGSESSSIVYSVTVGDNKSRVVFNSNGLVGAKVGYYLGFDSNAFLYESSSQPNIGRGAINNGYLLIGVPNTITTKEELISYLGAMGAEFVYELATPQTIQLTPTEVDTILGTNNVWSDVGNVYVKYVADTKLYILKVMSQ